MHWLLLALASSVLLLRLALGCTRAFRAQECATGSAQAGRPSDVSLPASQQVILAALLPMALVGQHRSLPPPVFMHADRPQQTAPPSTSTEGRDCRLSQVPVARPGLAAFRLVRGARLRLGPMLEARWQWRGGSMTGASYRQLAPSIPQQMETHFEQQHYPALSCLPDWLPLIPRDGMAWCRQQLAPCRPGRAAATAHAGRFSTLQC